ncbi:MAG TPA: Gfo/Idh/MocA family oxidoreductase, partial [Verrucomicrobiota bacterium]|nr:Gfo/Idh/MocA family oxidoreductase [Verrucomicrobiota bacterium]
GEDLMVLGTHLFDFLRMFVGDPLSVSARVQQGGRDITPADRRLVKDNVGWVAGDAVFATFGFRGGVHATFASDGRMRETAGHWGLELRGTRGVARIHCDLAPNVFLRAQGGLTGTGLTETWAPLDPEAVKDPPAHNLGPVDDWLAAIAENREPECSGRNAAWAVEMVMGVYRAALGGGHAPFPLPGRGHPLEA